MILALDVSSVCIGWAFGAGKLYDCNKIKHFEKKPILERFQGIRIAVSLLMARFTPSLVLIERPFPSKRGSMDVTFACYGAAAVAGMSATMDKVEVKYINHGTWRKKILGQFPAGKSPKGDEKKILVAQEVLKTHPQFAGIFQDDKGHDASDACGIWLAHHLP